MDKNEIKKEIEAVFAEYSKNAALYLNGDKFAGYNLTKLMDKLVSLHLKLRR